MEQTLKHAKQTRITPIDEDTNRVIESNYTDKLKTEAIRTEKRIKSTDLSMLGDLIECFSVFKQRETDELELTIKRDPQGNISIIKTWTIRKERY